MALHNALTSSNLHKTYPWSYANATARTGAGGFASGDLGHLALQLDDYSLWVLTATTPTWKRVDYDSSHTHSNATTSVAGFMAAADKTKLDGIETGATADQSANEILTALLGVDGASSLLDADLLDGQEGSYYRNAGNLNAGTLPALRFDDTAHGSRSGGTLHSDASALTAGFMSSSDFSKLSGIESGATADMSASEILAALLTVDGTSSGLDADKLDGNEASAFSMSGHDHASAYFPLGGGSLTGVNILRNLDTSAITLAGATASANGAAAFFYGRDHATAACRLLLRAGGYDATGYIGFQHINSSGTVAGLASLDSSKNLLLGAISTSVLAGTNNLYIALGTTPTPGTNQAAIGAADITAGNTAIHCWTENGQCVKLFSGAAVADATDAATTMARLNDLLARMRANGLILT